MLENEMDMDKAILDEFLLIREQCIQDCVKDPEFLLILDHVKKIGGLLNNKHGWIHYDSLLLASFSDADNAIIALKAIVNFIKKKNYYVSSHMVVIYQHISGTIECEIWIE
jgi:hypothetical protein